MNKSDIGDRLVEQRGLNKAAAKDALDSVFEAIGEAVAAGEEVQLAGFGTLGTRSRAVRIGRNTQTGEVPSIPALKIPSFTAAKALRDALNDA